MRVICSFFFSTVANGSDIRLIGTYVESPLTWSVSTDIDSNYNTIEGLTC